MQHYYFITWPRIMKIGQIDVLFAVTRSKVKHQVTYKDIFKGYNVILHDIRKTIFLGYPLTLYSIDTHFNASTTDSF